MPACFSSSKENPRPNRTLVLYLMVGHDTTGLSRLSGRGAIRLAFSTLVACLLFFLMGWLNQFLILDCQSLWKWPLGMTPLRFAGMADYIDSTKSTKERKFYVQREKDVCPRERTVGERKHETTTGRRSEHWEPGVVASFTTEGDYFFFRQLFLLSQFFSFSVCDSQFFLLFLIL